MSISVVIPTADRGALLREALESVVSQTRPADEILVVDNGRSRVGAQLRADFPTVTVLDLPPRSGASVSRNFGASRASGSYLAFLDDDDLWPPEYLARMEERALSKGADLVAAPRRIWGEGRLFDTPVPPSQRGRVEVWRRTGYAGSNILVRADSFWEAGGFRSQLITGEDRALFIDLVSNGCLVEICTETAALLREHPGVRLTDDRTLMQGKLAFLAAFGERMPAKERAEDRFATLVYMTRQWRWPVVLVGCLAAPRVALARAVRFVRQRLGHSAASPQERREHDG